MVDLDLLRRSPLAGAEFGTDGPRLVMAEDAFRTLVDVRGRSADVRKVAGGGAWVWRLGPDWWLVDGPAESTRGLHSELANRLRDGLGTGCSAVEVSSHRTTLVLEGADARNVLGHGCSIDLQGVSTGDCVQGKLALAQVAIACTGAAAYRVYVRASFARYLAAWLTDAAAEYE
ncbi:MAG: sarcosine oxidase subunit gamma family protein [Nocardioidaceae bacterium]